VPYHRPVQNLVLGAIVGIGVIVLVVGAVFISGRRGRIHWLQASIGIGIGLLGALLVLIQRTDLIPDGPEDGIERFAVIAVTVAAVVGTWYRIARA